MLDLFGLCLLGRVMRGLGGLSVGPYGLVGGFFLVGGSSVFTVLLVDFSVGFSRSRWWIFWTVSVDLHGLIGGFLDGLGGSSRPRWTQLLCWSFGLASAPWSFGQYTLCLF